MGLGSYGVLGAHIPVQIPRGCPERGLNPWREDLDAETSLCPRLPVLQVWLLRAPICAPAMLLEVASSAFLWMWPSCSAGGQASPGETGPACGAAAGLVPHGRRRAPRLPPPPPSHPAWSLQV